MTYVLDPSVALKVVLPEADSARAIRLRDEYANGVHTLLAPDLFTAELANGRVAAERQSRIKPGESALLLRDLLLNAPAFSPSNPLLVRAMEVALATRRAVYDCVYLALAEREGCELVTADDQFARGLRGSYPFIISLVALP
jgi:predicted nucleic acid-binding protein